MQLCQGIVENRDQFENLFFQQEWHIYWPEDSYTRSVGMADLNPFDVWDYVWSKVSVMQPGTMLS